MVPNDDPFANTEVTEPVSSEATPVVEAPSVEPTPVVDTSPTQTAALASAVEPLKEAITALNERITQATTPAPVATPEPPTDDEFGQQFYQNPRGTIQSEFDRAAQPLVGQLADQVAEANMLTQAQRVDKDWGQGAFAAVIESEFRPIVEEAKRLNPQGLLDRTSFNNAVDTVVGRRAKELVEFAKGATEALSKSELETVQKLRDSVVMEVQPNLSGGIRRGGPGAIGLSDEQKQIARDMTKADGIKRDEKILAALQANPIRSIEDYRAAKQTVTAGEKK